MKKIEIKFRKTITTFSEATHVIEVTDDVAAAYTENPISGEVWARLTVCPLVPIDAWLEEKKIGVVEVLAIEPAKD